MLNQSNFLREFTPFEVPATKFGGAVAPGALLRTGLREEDLKRYVSRILEYSITKDRLDNIKISSLYSSRNKVFKLSIGKNKFILKIDLEDDEVRFLLNEKLALEILTKNKIRNIPQVYCYDRRKKFRGRETIILNFIENDTGAKISSGIILKLVSFLDKLHAIKSNYFTIPFESITQKYKGNSYDFVNSFFDNLKKQIEYKELKNKLRHLIRLISKEIKLHKQLFRQDHNFSFLHTRLVRDEVRQHILLQGRQIYIIDWATSCFGDREFELATFLRENRSISSQFKNMLSKEYSFDNPFKIDKLKIYNLLTKLDGLIEFYESRLTKNITNWNFNIKT